MEASDKDQKKDADAEVGGEEKVAADDQQNQQTEDKQNEQEAEIEIPEPDELAELNSSVLDKICSLDNFKMYRDFLPDKKAEIHLKHYGDCEAVTDPSKRGDVLLLLRGAVVIISDERAYKNSAQAVRRTRRKRERAAEKRRQREAQGLDPEEEAKPPAEGEEQKAEENAEEAAPAKKGEPESKAAAEERIAREFLASSGTDFPQDRQIIAPDEFKLLNTVGATFGNDKVVTTRNFRPSYAVSVAPDTVVVSIPARLLEEMVRKLQNSGENREKTLFMKNFAWFENFTQSNQAKFNQCIKKVEFYPGSKIIVEGMHSDFMYIIIEGTCNLICRRSTELFLHLEYQNDPSKRDGDADYNYLEQKRRGNNQERAYIDSNLQSSASLRALTSNGYVSKTLKTVQLGMKSRPEWIGEDLLAAEDPAQYCSIYTAQAVTRMTCYKIPWQDVQKIVPAKSREQMIQIVKTRRKMLEERTLQLYTNLKNIQKNLETGELFSVSEAGKGADVFRMQKATVSSKVQKIGNKVREMVLKDNHEPTEKDLKALRIQESNIKQAHEVMRSILERDPSGSPVRRQVLESQKQIAGIRVIETERVEETVALPSITPNPKDRNLQGKLHTKSYTALAPANGERPSTLKETLTLTAQDLANYSRTGAGSPARLLGSQAIVKSTPALVNPAESYAGPNSAARSAHKPLSGVPSLNSALRQHGQPQQPYGGQARSRMGPSGVRSMHDLARLDEPASALKLPKTPGLEAADDSVTNYSSVIGQQMPQAHEAYGSHLAPSLKNSTFAPQLGGGIGLPPGFSSRSQSLISHGRPLIGVKSEISLNNSRTNKSIHAHNQAVNQKAQANQFKTHNYADEVLNKPLEKRAFLANARSLRPFVDPNSDVYSTEDGPRTLPTTTKLRPKFYSKEYAKLRSVLPTIYQQQQELEVAGRGAASRNDDAAIIEKSLIYQQMQAMQKASEYERIRQHDLQVRRQEIIDERDKSRRITANKAKQFEQRLKAVAREINGRPNPHLQGAMRALKLQVSDFSLEDKLRAEELLKREQFKVQIADAAKKKFKAIDMFQNKNGASALKETPLTSSGIAVAVPVFEDRLNEDDSEEDSKEKEDRERQEYMIGKASGPIAIMGISPQKGIKKISLNQQIQDEQLNQAILDQDLVQKLLSAGASSVSPGRSRLSSLTKGSSAQRGYVHAFDRLKEMSAERLRTDSSLPRTQDLEREVMKDFKKLAAKNNESADTLGGVAGLRQAAEERPETPNRWYQHQKKKLLLRYQKHLLEADLNAREFNLKMSMQRKAKERRVKMLEQLEEQRKQEEATGEPAEAPAAAAEEPSNETANEQQKDNEVAPAKS